MSEQTFVQQLVQESLPVWEQCLHSEFLERLADGTLDEACTCLDVGTFQCLHQIWQAQSIGCQA